MLPQVKIEQIEKLLAEGRISQRKIALLTGVSRGVISQVALGRRPDYEGRQVPYDDALQPTGQVARCPTCGARVYMPCRLCHVRDLQEQTQLKRLRRRAKQKAARRLLAALLRRKAVEEALAAEKHPPELPDAERSPANPNPAA